MIGIDVVDVGRMRAAMQRMPEIETRLFSESERRYCSARHDPVVHLAGTLAAKEAVVKALGLPGLWASARRIEIRRGVSGAPGVYLDGMRTDTVHISISHHGSVAVAAAVRQQVMQPVTDRSASSRRRHAS